MRITHTEMNNEQQLNNLAEDVREQGLSQSASMKDLVFDPVTGDFRQVPRGSQTGEGDIVTEMTNKGFAAEGIPDEVVYMREDDLKKVVGILHDKKRVRIPAEEIDDHEDKDPAGTIHGKIFKELIPALNREKTKPDLDMKFVMDRRSTDYGSMLDSAAYIYPFPLQDKQHMLDALSVTERAPVSVILSNSASINVSFSLSDRLSSVSARIS